MVVAMTKAGDESGKLPVTPGKVTNLMELDVYTAPSTCISLPGAIFTSITGFIMFLAVIAAFYPLMAGIPSLIK